MLSDYVMTADPAQPSVGIALEGGPQSFAQMVNMLDQGVRIHALMGLRDDDNGRYQNIFPFFSATGFLFHLQAAVLANPLIDLREVNAVIDEYLHDPHLEERLPSDPSKHLYANPARHDFATKLPLLDGALRVFREKEIWKKLPSLLHTYERKGAEYEAMAHAAPAFPFAAHAAGPCTTLRYCHTLI